MVVKDKNWSEYEKVFTTKKNIHSYKTNTFFPSLRIWKIKNINLIILELKQFFYLFYSFLMIIVEPILVFSAYENANK